MGDAARTRAALNFVCGALHRAGVHYVDAECLRLAKHADTSVSLAMWALVADLLEFLQISTDGWTPVLRESPMELSALEKETVVFKLMLLGYPRADHLIDTRELLLAVGYLLSASQLLTAARRLESRHPLPPYPDEIACSERLSPIGRPAADGDGLCNLLQLHGRWRAETRRLEQLEAHRLMLLKQMQELTSSRLQTHKDKDRTKKFLQSPPTQYELFVLERSLQEHLEDLQQYISNVQANKDEELFWRWMGSVFRATGAEGIAADSASLDISHTMQNVAVLDSLQSFEESAAALKKAQAESLRPAVFGPRRGACKAGSLRDHWDALHKSLSGVAQGELKQELRDLGTAFDAAFPAVWNENTENAERTTDVMQAHVVHRPSSLPTVLVRDSPDARVKLGTSGASIQEHVHAMRACYTSASQEHGVLLQEAVNELDGALAMLEDLRVLAVGDRKSVV